MSYRKHYPKGPHAATPYLPDELAPGTGCFIVDGKELNRRMVRAYHRRDRWQYHVARRRPAIPRPPTAAERTVARLRYYAAELAEHVAPFRLTRPEGHGSLRGLLHDADTRPAIVGQVCRLRSCLTQVRPLYRTHRAEVAIWRTEWDTATPERQYQIRHVHLAQLTQDVLNGLQLLADELLADAARIVAFLPEAFPASANEWWYTAPLDYWQAPAGPAPYSA